MHKKQILSQVGLFLNRGLKGTILLRHAHRESIPNQSFGNEIPITPEGHQAAVAWGQTLCSLPLEIIESSPVLRCLQTAECLQIGFQKQIVVNSSSLLGNPGLFIADPKEAEQLFLNETLQDILKNLVTGVHLKGMHQISVGIARFFNELLFRKEKLTLLITHDSIMIPICCYLFESIDIQKYRPDFLEALLIFYDEDQLYCCFRNHKTNIARTLLPRSQRLEKIACSD
ncbi:MAG: histidine phosphatase family protein [Chlamydiales bacterium]